MRPAEVLIHVEDPGAANYVAGLPAALTRRGVSAAMLAGGKARDHLAALGCDFDAVPADADAASLLSASGARLVLVGTAEDRDTLGLPLIEAARAQGIASVAVVDGPHYPGERFRGRRDAPLSYVPDLVLVPDEATKHGFVSFGLPAASVVVAGHPLFDRVRRERSRLDLEGRAAVRGRVLPGCPEGCPVLVFLAEISDGLRPELYRCHAGYRLSGRGRSDLRTNIVIEELLDASRGLGLFRVLRLHPKNTVEEFTDYVGEFDAVSNGGAPHDLVYAADLVAGMTTMLLAEAALLGRPTLSIVPDPAEASWLPTAGCGITPVVSSRADIGPAVRAGLASTADHALIDRALPAGAQDRVADLIVTMLGTGAPTDRRSEKESA